MRGDECLSAEDLVCTLGGRAVLRGVSFVVKEGGCLVVYGDNGSGKTVLCDALCGLVPGHSGTVRALGADIGKLSARKRFRSYMSRAFQVPRFPSRVTVRQWLGLSASGGLWPRLGPRAGSTMSVRGAQALALARELGVAGLLDRPGSELSDGERRLAALAAVVLRERPCLILDEPLAGLSGDACNRAMSVLAREKLRGKGLVVIEHRMDTVLALADQTMRLYHDGTSALSISPEGSSVRRPR